MLSSYDIKNDFNELEFPANSSFEELCVQITKNAFEQRLLFALIETTTISNVSGVGTTQYIAYKDFDYIQNKIHTDYDEIITIIKKTPFGGPSKYFDWYKRSDHYYAMGSNKVSDFNKSLPFPQTHKINSQKKSVDKYITDYTTKLEDPQIREFFDQYVQCFLDKEWFKELPNYFILVKPVSVKDEANLYIPLGNIYIAIGTKSKIEKTEYEKYVSRLQAAWFFKFGGKLLKEFSTKKISDEYKPKSSQSKPLSNILSRQLSNYNGKMLTLNDFFYYAFDLDEYNNLKNIYLVNDTKPIINDLIEIAVDKSLDMDQKKKNIIKTIEKWYDSKDDPNNILCSTAKSSILKTINSDSIRYFLCLLSKRRLALALLLIFDFTLEEAHPVLAFGDRENKISSNMKAHTDFFSNNLFITQANPVKNVVPLLADRERLFLTKIVEKIKSANSNFECKLLA